MNKTNLTALLLLTLINLACEKNQNPDRLLRPGGSFAGTVTLTGAITTNRTLSRDTLYLLKNKVLVTSGHTLTIEPGVRIEGISSTDSTGTAALIIMQGAQIRCSGLPTDPVVFSSHEAHPAPGDWGGIILLGKAPAPGKRTRFSGIIIDSTVTAASHISAALLLYGGLQAGDNSGTITYTRIEYAGQPGIISPLTLCSTGNATLIQYIEVAWSKNNAFEFRGGTTPASNLISLAPRKEAFATSQEYNGRIEQSLAVTDHKLLVLARNDTTYGYCAAGDALHPRAHPIFNNITAIGIQTPLPGDTINWPYAGIFTRTEGYQLTNSLFLGYFRTINNTDSGYNLISTPASARSDANDPVQLISPWDHADFRPASTSPAVAGGKPGTSKWRGAFEPDLFPWTGVWARFDY